MPLILAVEPDRRQASQITRIVRDRVRAELLLADTTERALDAIGNRVPDLVLVPALLSPQDDAALAAALRVIAAAAHVRTLTIPVLGGSAPEQSSGRGVLGWLRGGKSEAATPAGCDPATFADQIVAYLEEIAAERRADAEAKAQDDDIALPPSNDDFMLEQTKVAAAVFAPASDAAIADSSATSAFDAALVYGDANAAAPAGAVEQPLEQLVATDPLDDENENVIDLSDALTDIGDDGRSDSQPSEPAAVYTMPSIDDLTFDELEFAAKRDTHAARHAFVTSADVNGDNVNGDNVSTDFDVDSELLSDFAQAAQVTDDRETGDAPAAVTADTGSVRRMDGDWSLGLTAVFAWPQIEGVSAEPPAAAHEARVLVHTPSAAAVARSEQSEWIELVASLRQDLERRRTEPQRSRPAAAATRRAARSSPVQDEWGFFDPQQCGFAALLAKLDEITEA